MIEMAAESDQLHIEKSEINFWGSLKCPDKIDATVEAIWSSEKRVWSFSPEDAESLPF